MSARRRRKARWAKVWTVVAIAAWLLFLDSFWSYRALPLHPRCQITIRRGAIDMGFSDRDVIEPRERDGWLVGGLRAGSRVLAAPPQTFLYPTLHAERVYMGTPVWPVTPATPVTRLTVVFVPIALIAIIITIVAGFRWAAVGRSPGFPECEHCGFNLTGNESGVCPECGRSVGRGSA